MNVSASPRTLVTAGVATGGLPVPTPLTPAGALSAFLHADPLLVAHLAEHPALAAATVPSGLSLAELLAAPTRRLPTLWGDHTHWTGARALGVVSGVLANVPIALLFGDAGLRRVADLVTISAPSVMGFDLLAGHLWGRGGIARPHGIAVWGGRSPPSCRAPWSSASWVVGSPAWGWPWWAASPIFVVSDGPHAWHMNVGRMFFAPCSPWWKIPR